MRVSHRSRGGRSWIQFSQAAGQRRASPLNGAATFADMRRRIAKYRRSDLSDRRDFEIGCRILTQPFFLPEFEWIPLPASWSNNIVTFKTYSTNDAEGRRLWEAVQGRVLPAPGGFSESPAARFGEPTLVRPRLGQGAFRVLVTDLYGRRCAVTRERTLPALDAAHIRPYSDGGEHAPTNGLLLRRDVHSLFDAGYVTVAPEHKFEVSHRIREEYENGRDYYALHGRSVDVPANPEAQPDRSALRWHNENRFRG